MFDRPTIADLRKNKGVRRIITMHVDNAAEAAAARAAGIEMFTCEVDENLPGIRAAAPRYLSTGRVCVGHDPR